MQWAMQDTSCAHGLQKFPVRPAGQKRVYRRHSDRVEATNGVIPSVSGHRKLRSDGIVAPGRAISESIISVWPECERSKTGNAVFAAV